MKKLVSLFIVIVFTFSIFLSVQANEYMNVYSLDGRVKTIRTADFNAWHAVGWYSVPVMYVYSLDNRMEIIKTSDYDAWRAVGWYNQPMMYIYNIDGRERFITQKDYNDNYYYYSECEWYPYPVMYVYAADGRRQIVPKTEAQAWKSVGWDYQTSYADNIPFWLNSQEWAIIDLSVGPYSDWKDNRNYYIDKYFIEMPREDRLNIKHYRESQESDYHKYLIIPRHKTTNTVAMMGWKDNVFGSGFAESGTLCSVGNGVPFSVGVYDPIGDFLPILKLKNNEGCEFVINQNLLGTIGGEFDNDKVLDLTEWKYSRY